MKKIQLFISTLVLVFAIHTVAVAQSVSLTGEFKKSFNETVQKVQKTENANEKRELLNNSFEKMVNTIDRVASLADFSEEKNAQLDSYKSGITDMQNELNGIDGFAAVPDANLDDFSNYSQQFIEQADRTITIGITTALLILIILLLL